MKRDDVDRSRGGEGLDTLARSQNLSRARKKDERVPLAPVPILANRALHGILDRVPRIRGAILDVDRERPPFDLDDRRVTEVLGDGRRIERGRHHDDREVLPSPFTNLTKKGESEVGLEAALVKLVENDGRDPVEEGVVLNPPEQDAFGHHLETRPRRAPALEAHAVADLLADLPAALLGDAKRRSSRGDSSRLEQKNLSRLSVSRFEKCRRHTRCLARPRRRDEHERTALRDVRDDAIEIRIDRKRLQGRANVELRSRSRSTESHRPRPASTPNVIVDCARRRVRASKSCRALDD